MSLTAEEKAILELIQVRSDNDPANPEFPADDPKFPATPTYQIELPGFSNVWLKDESHNPTGTHKDRMAWELVVTYRNILLARQESESSGPLPVMSLISSGSAATAIQTQFRKYGLPNLKVLVDSTMNNQIIAALKSIDCEIYTTDLSKEPLDSGKILALTENPNGFDITSNDGLDPDTRFYDWLAYEVLNNSPDYCFIPFGTGLLYENILNINKLEITRQQKDPRFNGDINVLGGCNFLGVTTNDPNSKAEKLYSPHLPFAHFNEQWIRIYRAAGYCGSGSDLHLLKEEYLDQAMALAEKQNIVAEPSGISGLALLLQLQEGLPKDKKILVVSTGKTKYPTVS